MPESSPAMQALRISPRSQTKNTLLSSRRERVFPTAETMVWGASALPSKASTAMGMPEGPRRHMETALDSCLDRKTWFLRSLA